GLTTKPPSPAPSTFVACRLTTTGVTPGTTESNPAAASTAVGTREREDQRSQAATSTGCPKTETGITAPSSAGASLATAAMASGSRASVRGSTSTKNGTRPPMNAAWAEATNVHAG